MKQILFIVFILIQLHASSQDNIDTAAVKEVFFARVCQSFYTIDSLRHKEKNTVELKRACDSLESFIESSKNDVFLLKDSFDFNQLTIIFSNDKKACLISWDTRLGTAMPDFASAIIYKSTDTILFHQQKQAFVKGQLDNPKIKYTAIYTLHTKEKTVYIAKGFGQASAMEPWQEIKAFTITDTGLSNINILPGKKTRVLVAINKFSLGNTKKIPPLSFDPITKVLVIPQTNRERSFTGKYKSYLFNGKKFKKIKDKDINFTHKPY